MYKERLMKKDEQEVDSNMTTPNIDFLMKMAKLYLGGELDSLLYSLDFPYEVETRYKALLKEDRELAELIYDCLVEDGAYLYDDLTEEDFREKISKEYESIKDIYEEGFDVI